MALIWKTLADAGYRMSAVEAGETEEDYAYFGTAQTSIQPLDEIDPRLVGRANV